MSYVVDVEKKIQRWKNPHQNHTASLFRTFRRGVGKVSIEYKCSCGIDFTLGTLEESNMISEEVWDEHKRK
jgi:hypothetical protein